MFTRIIKSALISSFVLLAASATTAQAAVVYSQNFNDPAFNGGVFITGGSYLGSSDRIGWASTSIAYVNNVDGWTFSSGAYLNIQTSTGDVAILLNENYPGGTASTTVNGLVTGQEYQLSFLQWGDNEPGGSYQGTVAVDGTNLLTYSGVDLPAGTNPGTTRSVDFVASGTSANLLFGQQNSTYGASPIFDNVTVSPVPLPGGVGMFGAALLGLVGLGTRKSRHVVTA